MKDLAGLMQQAQKLQGQMQDMQQEIQRTQVTGESGGGLVKVVMNGRHDAKSVEIDPSLLTEDPAIIGDLVAAAINDAVRKVEAVSKDKMQGLAGGIPMPPGFNFNL